MKKNLAQLKEDHARRVVEEALRKANGKTLATARILGVSRLTVWRWKKKLGLSAVAPTEKHA